MDLLQVKRLPAWPLAPPHGRGVFAAPAAPPAKFSRPGSIARVVRAIGHGAFATHPGGHLLVGANQTVQRTMGIRCVLRRSCRSIFQKGCKLGRQGCKLKVECWVAGLATFAVTRGGAPAITGQLNQELHALVGQHFVAASDFHVGLGRIRVGDTTYAAVSAEAIQAGDAVAVMAVVAGRLKVARVS